MKMIIDDDNGDDNGLLHPRQNQNDGLSSSTTTFTPSSSTYKSGEPGIESKKSSVFFPTLGPVGAPGFPRH